MWLIILLYSAIFEIHRNIFGSLRKSPKCLRGLEWIFVRNSGIENTKITSTFT